MAPSGSSAKMSAQRSVCGVWSVLLVWSVCSVSVARGGLYSASDVVSVLSARSLGSVLNSTRATMLEFYATWCGHCAAFSPKWTRLATDIREWKPAVDVAAIDCAEEENRRACTEFSVRGYPSIKFFPAYSSSDFTGEDLRGFPRDVRGLRHLIIDKLESHKEPWPPAVPPLEPASAAEIDSYVQSSSVQHLVLLFEEDNSYVGREVILDMLQYENITVRRVLSSEKELVSRMSVTSFPSCYLYHSHTSFSRLPVLTEGRTFYSYALQRLPGVVRAGKPQPSITDLVRNDTQEEWRVFNRTRVYMSDLESALHYSLRVELAAHPTISGDDLTTLKHYTSVLAKYFPGRPAVRAALKAVDVWLQEQKGTSVSYSDFRAALDSTVLNSDTVLPVGVRWVGCQGSQTRYRGYPCAVWTLFHVLSVQADASGSKDPVEVLGVMRGYVAGFFGCRPCATHFELMAAESLDQVSSVSEAVLWLWTQHNRVNSRLAGDLSEDPHFPKLQWPPPDLCAHCHAVTATGEHAWNHQHVLSFLQNYYSAQRILSDYLQDEGQAVTHLRAQLTASRQNADAARRRAREVRETPSTPTQEEEEEEEEEEEAVTGVEEEEGGGVQRAERSARRRPSVVGLRLRGAREDIVDLDSFVNQHYKARAVRAGGPAVRDGVKRVRRDLESQRDKDGAAHAMEPYPPPPGRGTRWMSLLSVGFSRLDVSLCVLLYLLSTLCLLTMYLYTTVRHRLRRAKHTLNTH